MPKIKKYFFIFLLLELALSYTPAFAQDVYDYRSSGVEKQIRDYLCAPAPVNPSQTNTNLLDKQGNPFTFDQNQAAFNNTNSGDLYKCINQLYKFAIVAGAVVAVFFIVIAGYVYMAAEGNSEQVEKAKSILTSSIASLVILLVGYVLLKAINPDLIQFHSIQPPSVTFTPLGGPISGGNYSGGTPKGGGSCSVMSSTECSVNQLRSACSWDPNIASAICNIESSGGQADMKSGTDLCVDNASFSIGLFQINMITDAPNYFPQQCPRSIFASTDSQPAQSHCAVDKVTNSKGLTYCPHWNCRVANQVQYNTCVQTLSQASNNVPAACKMYSLSNTWKKWENSYGICIAR